MTGDQQARDGRERPAGAGPSGTTPLVLSGAQRALWAKQDVWVDRLHRKWSGNLARADCEEVIADSIVNSRLLRDARRLDGGLLRQWWAYDVKSAAIRLDSRLRGAIRKDGQRRGPDISLDASGDDGMPLLATLRPALPDDPAELVTEGLLGQSRRYRREQATVICAAAMAALRDKYRDILLVDLEGAGQPQRVLCQRLGLTEKAYHARLKVAREQFAKQVRAQRLGPECDRVRALLGRPLGADAALVEAHLEDCYPCRAWQLFHRQHAAAAVLPFPVLKGWEMLSTRAQSFFTRLPPGGELGLSHPEATTVGLSGTAAGTALLTGAGAKLASAICVSAMSCGMLLNLQDDRRHSATNGVGPPVSVQPVDRVAGRSVSHARAAATASGTSSRSPGRSSTSANATIDSARSSRHEKTGAGAVADVGVATAEAEFSLEVAGGFRGSETLERRVEGSEPQVRRDGAGTEWEDEFPP